MTAELTHDLKGYLQIIFSCAQLIQMESHGKSAGHAALIMEGAMDMRRALDRAAGGAVKRGSTSARSMVKSLCDRCRPFALERGVALSFCGTGDAAAPDAEKLSRIVLNLVNNAVSHTPPGGSVRVGMESADGIRIDVTDTGCGIPPEAREQVFLRGVSDAGSGLGLFISREFAREMGGDVVILDRAGEGCTFRLEIPCVR